MVFKEVSSRIGMIFVILGVIFASISVLMAYSIFIERNTYLREEDVHVEYLSVTMDDGVEIQGILYVDRNSYHKKDHSIPTILLLHGVHGRKENHLDKCFQLAKFGYAVFSVEQRGHGESGGITAFIGKEPDDMIAVLDYIEDNYEFSNSSHFGILGFSFGGGIGAVVQAKDKRVYASVLYHPLTSLKESEERMPISAVLGKTTEIPDFASIKDARKVCDPNNTKNLLLIQGGQDVLVEPKMTKRFYKQVDGTERDDIGLEIRSKLNHGQNEGNYYSFKYAMVWLEHFYHDASINITNREDEMHKMKLFSDKYPKTEHIPQYLLLIAIFLIFLGLSIIIVPNKIWRMSHLKSIDLSSEMHGQLYPPSYKKMIFQRIILYFIPVIIISFLCSIFNHSYFYGYFLLIPIATSLILILVPRSEYLNRKSEWFHWYMYDFRIIKWSLPIVLIPTAIFLPLHNLNAFLMREPPMPFLNFTLVLYIIMSFGVFYMDFMLIRGWRYKHTTILIILRPLTLFIFYIFNPIPDIDLENLQVMIALAPFILIFAIGIGSWAFLNLLELLRKYYRSKFIVLTLISIPIDLFFIQSLIRLF